MGTVVSSSQVVSATPSSSGAGLLTLFPCSSVRSLSWETVLHRLLQHESFPWAAALHELPQCGSLPTGCSPSGTGCSSVGTHGVTSPASKLLWCGLLPPRVRRSWQEPAPAWASHGITASFRNPPVPAWGPFHGLQMEIYSTVDLLGL